MTEVFERLDGLDEEQLIHIVDALLDTARRSEQLGLLIDAQKKRLTAEKVMEIKRQREQFWIKQLLGKGGKLRHERTDLKKKAELLSKDDDGCENGRRLGCT
ncbi:hypothetical protein P4V46_01340 [Brevibacillus borstelensis]|nr:hypothetical protein [Brevibacillus borstelensis]MED1881239.1 hypothetical protein [Brevibacillus borstelensis]GED55857.1 hypothetical protein BBO01nite_50980 [Brevibacillus borstelensis]